MTQNSLDITPAVTVHNLLEAYPELEDVLIGIAPPFKKLKNPILRRSVARVATIKHVSSVGGVPLGELINSLRKAVGQPPVGETYDEEDYFQEQPDWFSEEKVVLSLVESELEDTGQMTLVTMLQEARNVRPGEIIKLVTTFLPAPGIDIMKTKAYAVWTVKGDGEEILSYFLKNAD